MNQTNNPDRPRPAPRDPAWMLQTPTLAEVELPAYHAKLLRVLGHEKGMAEIERQMRQRREKAEVPDSMADDPWRPCDA